VVKRAKAGSTDKKAKKVALAAVRHVSGSSSGGGEHRRKGVEGLEEELCVDDLKTRSGEPETKVLALGKILSLQAGVIGQSKDRGIAPPALPIPIVTFTI
jgi:hypothetical protein